MDTPYFQPHGMRSHRLPKASRPPSSHARLRLTVPEANHCLTETSQQASSLSTSQPTTTSTTRRRERDAILPSAAPRGLTGAPHHTVQYEGHAEVHRPLNYPTSFLANTHLQPPHSPTWQTWQTYSVLRRRRLHSVVTRSVAAGAPVVGAAPPVLPPWRIHPPRCLPPPSWPGQTSRASSPRLSTSLRASYRLRRLHARMRSFTLPEPNRCLDGSPNRPAKTQKADRRFSDNLRKEGRAAGS